MIDVETFFVHSTRRQLDRSLWYNGFLLTLLATGEDTGGRFALVETVGRDDASATPPWHRHTREEECFYVLEGQARFYVGDQIIDADPGTFVALPRGVPHTYKIMSGEARLLNLCTPAGFEGFFRALSQPAQSLTLPPPVSGAHDIARLSTVAAAYGVEILGPPPA